MAKNMTKLLKAIYFLVTVILHKYRLQYWSEIVKILWHPGVKNKQLLFWIISKHSNAILLSFVHEIALKGSTLVDQNERSVEQRETTAAMTQNQA